MKKSQKMLVYIFITIVLAFALVGANIVDMYYNNYHIISTIVKLVAVGILSFYVIKARKQVACAYATKYTFLALLPLVFSFVLYMGWPNQKEYMMIITSDILSICLTAVVEELFFRVFAVGLMSNNGEFSFSDALSITLVYSLSFAVNFFIYDYKFVIFSIVLGFAFGLFLLGTYLLTKNVFACILSHLSFFLVRWFFVTFSSSYMAIGNVLFLVIVLVFIAILTMLGMIICKKETSKKSNQQNNSLF